MSLVKHLAVRCRDMEKTRTFYEQGFGWTFLSTRSGGGGLDLTDGEINITLIQQSADWSPARHDEGDEHLHFGVVVDDLSACWKRLEDLGAVFSKDSIKSGSDIEGDQVPQTSFKVFDPDGNLFDVTCNKEEWLGMKFS